MMLPTKDLLDKIRSNIDMFAAKYDLLLDDYSSLKLGKLFFGATDLCSLYQRITSKIRSDSTGHGIDLDK